MTLNGDGKGRFAIDFDLIWNKAIPQGCTKLELQLECIYHADLLYGNWRYYTIADAQSRFLADEERLKLMEDAKFCEFKNGDNIHLAHPALCSDLTLTTVALMNGGNLRVLHQGPVRIRVSNDAGVFFDVSKLAP